MAIYVNGIDAATGQYLPSIAPEQFARLAHRTRLPGKEVSRLRGWLETPRFRRLAEGAPEDLAQAGWGVIFAAQDERVPALRKALEPLLALRREQASRGSECLFYEFVSAGGYQHGESKSKFLARHRTGPGAANPRRMPYYLLLVGGPEAIPYNFQYQLDVEYAVGRVCFDTLEEYARYAEAVVAAEATPVPECRRLALFGTCHAKDPCTALSCEHLIAPLAQRGRRNAGWDVKSVPPERATKERLAGLLGGPETPDLLFTASHGVLYSRDDPRQVERQGALVCQDWPGPESGAVEEEHAFAACDVADDARVAGLIAFQFACFTAGSPDFEDLADPLAGKRIRLAPRPFLAKLPQRLLAHPKGGALAVIGHVERATPCSIEWPGAGRQIRAFEEALDQLMIGRPVGMAMECFGRLFAELAAALDDALEPGLWGKRVDAAEVGHLWVASRDARNYVVIGDPAVRLVPPPEPPEPPPVYRDGRWPADEPAGEEGRLRSGDAPDLRTRNGGAPEKRPGGTADEW